MAILLVVLILYFGIHIAMYPFKHVMVNHMETICIFLLILGLVVIIFGFHAEYSGTIAVIMAIIVLIPCLIIMTGFILFCYNYRRDKNSLKSSDIDSHNDINARIDGMKSRLTKTQKDLFRSSSGGRSNSSYHPTNEDSDELDKDEIERNIKTQNVLSQEDLDDNGVELTKLTQDRSTQL